jgi:hypothetical protein
LPGNQGLRAFTLLAALLASAPALAQPAVPFTGPGASPFAPPPKSSGPGVSVPQNPRAPSQMREPHAFIPAVASGRVALALAARYAADGAYIPRSLHWRVFAEKGATAGPPALVAEGTDPAPLFALPPGDYVVSVAYGLASATQRVSLRNEARREIILLPAGGLRLQGKVGETVIASPRLKFDVYEGSFLQRPGAVRVADRPPVLRGAGAGELVMLPAGAYYVHSTYGDGNAVIQADVRVDVGKLTDATVHHRAAQVTLRLVSAAGGEAIANTAWSVLTPGGDSVKESIGAFPSVILAEGEYVAIARNDGKLYSMNFRVEAGKDRDVEVLLAQLQRESPSPEPARRTR